MSIDSGQFRQVLGHFPTGVTIITGITDDGPDGLTIGSFTSVSLDPPLVGFLPMDSSRSWQAIAPTGRFCVNILGVEHADLCWKFARSAETARFEGVDWAPSPAGNPILAGAIGWIDCTIEETYVMGDHLFVLGRVTDLDVGGADEPRPLLFFCGKLGEFDRLG